MLVNGGLQQLRDSVYDAADFTHIALGTGDDTPSETDTALETESRRDAATQKKPATNIHSIYMTLNFVLGSLMVLAVGAAADRVGLDLTYKISAAAAVACIIFVIFLKMPAEEKSAG